MHRTFVVTDSYFPRTDSPQYQVPINNILGLTKHDCSGIIIKKFLKATLAQITGKKSGKDFERKVCTNFVNLIRALSSLKTSKNVLAGALLHMVITDHLYIQIGTRKLSKSLRVIKFRT